MLGWQPSGWDADEEGLWNSCLDAKRLPSAPSRFHSAGIRGQTIFMLERRFPTTPYFPQLIPTFGPLSLVFSNSLLH